ncbi:flagellin [Sulfurimonas gotlandica GD1]|uniref:Flagellin n=1 Tax=Sulfurimonas gotlandica (strain DSM 19862 / JCM 16533 / GD1) TaxID=929558 RepID=B6BGF3_SULGG|nr:flagellin [Sulfurimonas gotlandica]EDZ63165.1 flagellin B [Sulfurimonas gotlandica GD1]EHP29580.1 flagellin [Sulfurimonas gotlandica GD1]
MGFRINTNIGAMNAHRNATMNNVGLDKSLNSLSSGLRINKAADDSAGLAIANKLSAQSQGLGQAVRNSNDGIGLLQTADGALEEYGQILKRVRVLAVQASNDTQDATSRGYISQEVQALLGEANDIATTTKFNGVGVLNGTGGAGADGTFIFHTGAYTTETQSTVIASATVAEILSAAATTVAVTTRGDAEASILKMDNAMQKIDAKRATIGAAQNKLESTVRNISVTQVNIAAAESQIRDVDFAAESANFAKHNILAQSGSYAMSQANAVQQNVLRLLQ